MPKGSTILLETTAGQINATGVPVKGSGFFGSSSGNSTIAIYLNDFTGRVIIEGTLAAVPEEGDWFPIMFQSFPHIEFPQGVPTGINGDSGVQGITFRGNFVYLRARIDREYLPIPTDPAHGSIKKILLNF